MNNCKQETIIYNRRTMANRLLRSKGYVLLLVLMVMIVMTLLALEFQQESVIQVRMNKHRHDLVQCEYSLESGLVAAGKLIQEYNDDMISRLRKGQPAQSGQDSQKEDKLENLIDELKKLSPEQFSELIGQVEAIAAEKNDIVITEMLNSIDLENLEMEMAAPVIAGIITIAEESGLNEVSQIVNDAVFNNDLEIDYEMLADAINEINLIAQENEYTDISNLLDVYNQIEDPNTDDISLTIEQVQVIAEENQYEDIIFALDLIFQAFPNPTDNRLGATPEEWEEHLLKKHSLDIGNATVDIYIYGENYKLPLIWALKSQIGPGEPKNNNYNMPLVNTLIDELDPGNPNKQEIVEYLSDLTEGIEIPFAPGAYESNNLWRRRKFPGTNRMVELLIIRNHINFAPVGGQLYRDISNPHYQDVKDIITLPSGNLISDYLGIWGSTYINLNTAPVEVLTVGLKDIGVTRELAQKIVEWRETNSMFISPRSVREIDGIDNNMAAAISYLTRVVDNVFTVRVVAAVGDITKVKHACFHRRGSRLQLQAIY